MPSLSLLTKPGAILFSATHTLNKRLHHLQVPFFSAVCLFCCFCCCFFCCFSSSLNSLHGGFLSSL
ncbi:hypothetical protein I7I48_03735 [Histoplasma ohiense]|nr:hypothetical protein I7I48_03735 [Histoplasma ohiense (nom. inval.)]